MLKYWFKNRLIFSFFVSASLALIFCFAFAFIPSQNVNDIRVEESIYLNSSIDFQIPNPSIAQLNDIEKEPFVNNTFGYYLTKTNVVSEKSSKTNLLLTNDINKLDMTMLNSNTLINSIDNSSNFAYLDETASNALGVNVGSQIRVNLAESIFIYTVSRIYNANSLFKEGTIIVDFSGSIKETYLNNASENSLSGAFINSCDVNATDFYLNSYKPLGRLKERSEFESDEAYNKYNETVLSQNYKNEITNFSAKRESAIQKFESAKNKLSLMVYIGSIVVFVVYILLSLVLRNRKSESNYFKNVLKNKKKIKNYRLLSFIFDTSIYFLITIIVASAMNIFNLVLVPSIIAFIGFGSSFAINMIQDKKYAK